MTNYRFYIILPTVLFTTVILSGCESAKETLGMGRQVPDEFAVVKQEPLTLPPNYNLRPPRPGAPRPTSTTADLKAKEAVTGKQVAKITETGSLTGGEEKFLSKAGAQHADPDIREKIDSLEYTTDKEDVPVAKRIFGLGGKSSSAKVVDPEKESKRLRENLKSGAPVTKGETPTLEY